MKNKYRAVAALFVMGGLLPSSECKAESGEFGVFLTGGLLFPSFEPEDPVAFDLVTGIGGLGFTYGLTDDLWLDVRTTLTAYRGRVIERIRTNDETTVKGNLFFSSTQAHPTVGIQYNLYPGLNFSPYLIARGGFIYSTFRRQVFLNDQGQAFAGIEFDNAGQLQWTASVGLSLEYRLYEILLVGLEPTFTKAFGEGRNNWFGNLMLKVTLLLSDW